MKRWARAGRWGVIAASLSVLLIVGTTSATAAAASALDGKGRLLTVSHLPAGWHTHRTAAPTLDLGSAPCLRGLGTPSAAGAKKATASFAEGSSDLPAFGESLSGGATSATFDKAVAALGGCRNVTLTIDSTRTRAAIARISLPGLKGGSDAFSLELTVTHVPIGADIVLFRAGTLTGEVAYLGVGTPTPVTAEAFAHVAISKAEGHAVSPPQTVSVVSSPVKVAHTSMGAVGYREVGSGPALVMIMGFAGTMETWDPRLVDALAHDHEVVIFDNAGIGDTHALPEPLTIDQMANQTSALIRALGLKKPDILGWSMGSMIAQALAVLHPTRVSRLVLCASYPGTGTVDPSQQAINTLTGGTSTKAMAALFPPNQHGAAAGYEVSVSGWPTSAGAPAAVITAQEKAITTWWSGKDAAGTHARSISSPTLIADGTRDRLDPLANDHRLQRLIPGAELVLYPDAGHAFLFQDESVVAPRIVSFLAG